MAKKRARVTLGQKIVSIFFLSIGLFFLSLGAWAHFSGVATRPLGFDYEIMMVGAIFVIVAVIVVLDARSRVLPEEEPLSKDTHHLSKCTLKVIP